MKDFMASYVCHKLRVSNPARIEIEAKKKLSPAVAGKLEKYLNNKKSVKHIRSAVFMDQFLDTPGYDLFHSGASLRLRYKNDGGNIYLQYKGAGFYHEGVLFRSEFSSGKIKRLVREESLHDIIHFTRAGFKDILEKSVPAEMKTAMFEHLGPAVIKQITIAPVISVYRKEKFIVELGDCVLEPSLDHISAFHINSGSFHPLSNFWEYENEIKSKKDSLEAKLPRIGDLMEFDAELSGKFQLIAEPMDKYHRILSFFIKPAA